MSFFSGIFGDNSPFGRNCQEVETDPNADPFEKEICTTMRHFEESFSRFPGFGPPIEYQDHDDTRMIDTPQSRRDAILTPEIREKDSRRSDSQRRRRDIWQPSTPQADQNLDARVAENPSALEELLRNDQAPEQRSRPHIHSHSSSVIISTVRKPDGTIEQRKTVRDSDGNEEVTVSYHHDGSDGTTVSIYPDESGRIISERGPGRGMLGKLSDWLSGND